MIDQIKVSGYKNLQSVSLLNVARVNYLVGKNGSGKSSFLECLKIFSNVMGSYPMSSNRIEGLTGYHLRDDLDACIIFSNGKDVTLNIPKNTQIEIGTGSFSVPSLDPVTCCGINANSIASNIVRSQFVKQSASWTFSSAYVSTINTSSENQEYNINPQPLSFDFNNIDSISESEVIQFLNEYYSLKDFEEVSDISSSIRKDKAIQFTISNKNTKVIIKKIALTQLSGGYKLLAKLYFSLVKVINKMESGVNIVRIVCLEEPEAGFHPQFQKKIPEIISRIIAEYEDVHFFITTHSPFIISSATIREHTNVYLFNDGSLVNKALDYVEESSGYSNSNCLNVVSKMLNAGLADLALVPKINQVITVVYCEGKSKDIQDSDIYKKIFRDLENYIFLGCGSFQECINSCNIASESLKFVFGDKTRGLALLDCSCSSNNISIGPLPTDYIEKTSDKKLKFSDDDRNKILESDELKNLRMLKRKEIENYLFDKSVVDLLNGEDIAKVQYNDKASKESIDYIEGEVKDIVSSPPDIKLKLADLIYQHREKETKDIYNELYECLTSI